MFGGFKIIFSGSSDFAKGTLNEVKDEALGTFRLYKNLIIICIGLFCGLALAGILALLKVIFGG